MDRSTHEIRIEHWKEVVRDLMVRLLRTGLHQMV